MSSSDLENTARKMVADGKGILAADDTDVEMFEKFRNLGIPETIDNIRRYRAMLFTSPDMDRYLSAIILCQSTLESEAPDGSLYASYFERKGIVPGALVDGGLETLPSSPKEVVTRGIGELGDRLASCARLGARFAKWQAVYFIGDGRPSAFCIEANALKLARYASMCQQARLVPIVEPDVQFDGDHSLDESVDVTRRVLNSVFRALDAQDVKLSEIVLKPSMVLPGRNCPKTHSLEEIAEANLQVFTQCVPDTVPGIAYLSGGQPNEDATSHLDAINKHANGAPWQLTFCYGRALQGPALSTWCAEDARVETAQQAFIQRARLNAMARSGMYDAEMESATSSNPVMLAETIR